MTDKPRTWNVPQDIAWAVGRDSVVAIELEPVLDLLEAGYTMGADEWDEGDAKDRTRALLREHGRLS